MSKVNTSKLKRVLKKLGVKQKDIALYLGVSTQFVSQVVNGKRSSNKVMMAIATAINRPVSDFFPEEKH